MHFWILIFFSKSYSVQDDKGNHLIDQVIELPEYKFFCHEQVIIELNRHHGDAPLWLKEKNDSQKIISYTDQAILKELTIVRGSLACATYTEMSKNSV